MKIVWLTVSMIFVLAFVLVGVAHNAMPASIDAHETADDSSALFAKHCADCHGKDGRAKGFKAKAKGTRNLTDPQWQDRVSDERIFNAINNGKGRMPAFGKKLSETQVNSLVQYVRGLKR
ncbi:MAG: cytochrome c class [Acidobacteria bacterium]|nr:cytochrome c class [Acidobacteriota bacterium]